MKMSKIGCLFLVVLLFMVSCKNNQPNNKVKIMQEWFANANFVGEIAAMQLYDSIQGVDIEIIEGSYDIDPIKMVLSDEVQIGVAGADKVLIANSKGADFVVFGVLNKYSPTCFLSLKENKIIEPKDFIGHKVGVLTGTATEYVYRALLKKQEINASQLEEQEVSFDLNTFINGIYDVRPAFIYDEPVSLGLQNIDYDIIEPKDYGVQFLGTVYFCKKSFVDQNPDLAQKIVNALAKGWEYSLKHPEEAIKLLKQYSENINSERELISLAKGRQYFLGENDKVLTADTVRWREMCNTLVELNVIKSYDLDFLRNDFILKYHE